MRGDVWDLFNFLNNPDHYEVSVNRDGSFNVRDAHRVETMKPYPTYKAGRLMCWVLDRFDFAGITMPWRVVYIHPDYMEAEWLARHERQHIKQIDRMGAWKWSFLIVWCYLRYGYRYSPLEIEARDAETIE